MNVFVLWTMPPLAVDISGAEPFERAPAFPPYPMIPWAHAPAQALMVGESPGPSMWSQEKAFVYIGDGQREGPGEELGLNPIMVRPTYMLEFANPTALWPLQRPVSALMMGPPVSIIANLPRPHTTFPKILSLAFPDARGDPAMIPMLALMFKYSGLHGDAETFPPIDGTSWHGMDPLITLFLPSAK